MIRCRLATLILLVSGLMGCGKPFDVKPRTKVDTPTATTYTAKAEVNGLMLNAEALTDEDKLYDTFDGNLILAGILPVRVKLQNSGAEKVELKSAKFELRGATNSVFKLLEAEKAYKQLRKYYGITIYNKRGNSESKADFSTYALDVKKSLAGNETREGLLFFAVPNEVIKEGNFRLVVRKLNRARSDSPLELQLQ